MARYDYDLFTIGAGSGGVRASRMAAGRGARAAVAERSALGGTCVNAGCIPKKLLVYAAHFHEEFEDAAGFGWSVGARSLDWGKLIAEKDREIARLNGIYRKLLDDAGVDLLQGHARLVDAHTIELDGRSYTAENVLLATGSFPFVPDFSGREHVITSDEAFHLERLPERVVVVGGGYIAVEFAGIFHGMGAAVTQVHRGPRLLRDFDHDLGGTLAEEMSKKGIELCLEAEVASVERIASGLKVALSDGAELEADQVLFATGRVPLTRDLGLEAANVELNERGAVVVDAYSRTSVPHIWAIGDITDRIMLTPVAIHEGMALVETLYGGGQTAPDHSDVPSAVFSQPAIGSVGLSESDARERYGEVDIYRSRFRALKHTLSGRDEQTLMKLVVARESQRVVGCHMVGPEAGEIVQGLAIALKCGATKAQFDATVGIHPTSAEEFVTMRETVT